MASIAPEIAGFLYAVALGTTLLVCLNARVIGAWAKVMAFPDAIRKRHATATPQLGGAAILLGVIIWLAGMLLLKYRTDGTSLSALLLCAGGVGSVGFTDDQHGTSPLSRILLLIVFLGVAVSVNPELITRSLRWASFDQGRVPVWIYCAMSGTAVIGLVNAVNMADGQNGVVGSMFAVWSICLWLVSSGLERDLAGLVFASNLVCLIFNLRGRVFLGDCGTYGVTFVFAMMTIAAHAQGRVAIESVAVWYFVPVMDCLRLLISRPLRGRSPFDGDRDHFHHRLEDKLGKSFGLLAYAGAVGLASITATLAPRFALLCLTGLAAFYFSFAWLSDKLSFEASQAPSGSGSPSNVIAMSATESGSSSKSAQRP